MTGAQAMMEALCGYLSHQLRQPVADQTGLKGIYDFRLAFAPDDPEPSDIASARRELTPGSLAGAGRM